MPGNQSMISARRCLGALLCAVALFGGLLAMAAGSAPAPSGSGTWQPAQVAIAPDGTSRVLWEASTTAGFFTSIWKMDSRGNVLAKSAVYGPYTDSNGTWEPALQNSMAVAPDGSMSLLWVNSNQFSVEVSVWKFDAGLNHTATGPVYGPYTDSQGLWTPSQFVGAPDGTARLLWIYNLRGAVSGNAPKSGNVRGDIPASVGPRASIWSFDKSGAVASIGPAYGPYSQGDTGWSPTQLAVAPDGTSRIMWTTSYPTAVSFWTLSSAGVETHAGPVYGPYTNWNPGNFDIDSADGTLRLLWLNDSQPDVYGDQVSAWSLTTQGVETTMGQTYGPYQNWFANAIYANPDATSAIEWSQQYNNGSGTQYAPISFWTLNSVGQQVGATPVYGPYTGTQGNLGYGWRAQAFAHNPANGAFRILWSTYESVGLMSVWSLNPDGTSPIKGPAYGPYTYGG